jgi:hypothetical protein
MGSGSIAPPFLTSVLHRDEWSASRPCRFTPMEIAPGTHLIGGWVNRRISLHSVEKRQILPCRESNLGSLACIQQLCRLSYPDSRFIVNVSRLYCTFPCCITINLQLILAPSFVLSSIAIFGLQRPSSGVIPPKLLQLSLQSSRVWNSLLLPTLIFWNPQTAGTYWISAAGVAHCEWCFFSVVCLCRSLLS